MMEMEKELENPRFQVRESEAELKKLDEALMSLGYVTASGKADRAGWYRMMKRQAIMESTKGKAK